MALEVLSNEEKERLRGIYEALPSNVPKVYEPYPVKRKKLAKVIHDIDLLIEKGEWTHWRSWASWDFSRLPISYCFVCLHPVKLKPSLNQYSGKLVKLECEHCGLIHFDSKYD